MRKTLIVLLGIGLATVSVVAQSPKAIDPANMDPSIKACENFYQYADGGWVKANPVPADKSAWGSFAQLADHNRDILRSVLDEVSAKKEWPKGSLEQKVGDFYASGMEEAAVEKAGTAPLKPWLAKVEGLKSDSDLASLLGELRVNGLAGAFNFMVAQDARESTRYIGILNQGGLGLPDRDYYIKEDPKTKEIRDKYVAHVTRMLELAGEKPDSASADAKAVMAVETQLAKASFTRVENRDPQKTYHKMTLAELEKLSPAFGWKTFFGELGVKQVPDLNVRQPQFFKAFAEMSTDVPPEQWRAYLRWHVINAMADLLTKAFQEESFAFRGKALNGIPEQEERWKRVQAATDRALGEALGQLYVKRAFSADAKARMIEMVENLHAALKDRIEGLEWMSPETKAQALRKLTAFGVKVGYPDKWRDYSKLEITRPSYADNVMRARRFESARNLAKLGKQIDRTEWGMTPPTVNAYYNSTLNEIVFPAGILQPPFFDPKADDAVNYGGIGAVIGHEMSHGFDDSGSQFDADGNLKNWWTDADRAAYKSRTDLIVKQFDAYEPLPGEHVNGKLTLGENIGDLGGLKIAYAALQKALENKGRPGPIDGFTPEQRFFLNWAQVWRTTIRDPALRVHINTNPHSPGMYRVNGPLSDLPEFYQAFGCDAGEAMVRPKEQRPSIW
ncbi:MAG: M13 family metallopeptidase [Acidobacteriia bacterium]|nr:M13 family metallopeptidase [Terriglobia bacterium]